MRQIAEHDSSLINLMSKPWCVRFNSNLEDYQMQIYLTAMKKKIIWKWTMKCNEEAQHNMSQVKTKPVYA